MSAADQPSAADTLRPLLYGDVPMAQWPEGDVEGEPWASFIRAREAMAASDTDGAAAIWTAVTQMPDLESRQYLQAWTFLRQAGHQDYGSEAKRVLAVMVEMPIEESHDLLVAYEDGSCRYLNHGGGASVIEGGAIKLVAESVGQWLEVGRQLVARIGSWDEPALPDLPAEYLRLLMLTPSGPHFGQGPEDVMMDDQAVLAFVGAATSVLEQVMALTAG